MSAQPPRLQTVEMGLESSRFNVCNAVAFKDESYIAGLLQKVNICCCDHSYVVHLEVKV